MGDPGGNADHQTIHRLPPHEAVAVYGRVQPSRPGLPGRRTISVVDRPAHPAPVAAGCFQAQVGAPQGCLHRQVSVGIRGWPGFKKFFCPPPRRLSAGNVNFHHILSRVCQYGDDIRLYFDHPARHCKYFFPALHAYFQYP